MLHVAKEPLKVASPKGNSGLEAEFENYGTNSKMSPQPPIKAMEVCGPAKEWERKEAEQENTHLDLTLDQMSNKQNQNQNKSTTTKHIWAYIIRK